MPAGKEEALRLIIVDEALYFASNEGVLFLDKFHYSELTSLPNDRSRDSRV